MEVKLVTWTMSPESTIAWAFANMHNPIPSSLAEFEKQNLSKYGKEEWNLILDDLLEVLATNPHSSVLEFVNTVWSLKGLSRAFQQQLTRSRNAAYSIQSLRVVPVEDFAYNKSYTTGPSLKGESENLYRKTMDINAMIYKQLIDFGAKVEDARGILPLNIHSPITMAISLRDLQHLLDMRLCHLTQGEYREVGKRMIAEIGLKMGERFTKLFSKPCEKLGFCPMPVCCGKVKGMELHESYKGKHLGVWLKDERVG